MKIRVDTEEEPTPVEVFVTRKRDRIVIELVYEEPESINDLILGGPDFE